MSVIPIMIIISVRLKKNKQFRKPDVMQSLPNFDERNDVMHEICETGQKTGGVIVIDEEAIRLLWTYDKWLQKRIGLNGNGA